MPPGRCGPGWAQIAMLPTGGYSFGSADVPKLTAANDYVPDDTITGNATVSVTFPESGTMGIGAAMGSWCDVVWEPTQGFFAAQGNRAAASLTKLFFLDQPLGIFAPGALTASCTVALVTPNIHLVAGDPRNGGEYENGVWAWGDASLDMTAGFFLGRGLEGAKSVYDGDMFFGMFGAGQYNKGATNEVGGPWDTTDTLGGSPQTPVGLTATLVDPPAASSLVIVTVSVTVSAWSLGGIQAIALVDATGQNNGLGMLTAPGYLAPSSNTTMDSTAYGTQGVQVTDLRLCGI